MKRLITFIGAAVILVVIFGTIYGVVQQAQRSDANAPQMVLAEDAAAALNRGATPSSLATGHIDMGSSLAPFVIIYSKNGQVVAGSGYLNGTIAVAPPGILSAAQGRDYNIVSWQPQSGVRIAAVTVAANNYYVLGGRSLKQVELNENKALLLSFLGGVASVVVLGGIFFLTKERK